MRAVLTGTKMSRSGVTSPDMALGLYGNDLYIYVAYARNVCYEKEGTGGMLAGFFVHLSP